MKKLSTLVCVPIATILLCSVALGDSPDEDRIAGWTFDDADVRTLLDTSERHFGRRFGSTKLIRSQIGSSQPSSAISFDGKSGYIIVRHHEDFLLDAGTISCWVKARNVQRTQGILSKDANGFGDGGHITLSINAGKAVIRLQSVKASYEVAGVLRANQWDHIAVTFGNNELRLYINGRQVGSRAYKGGLGSSSGGSGNREPLVIGASTINSETASEKPLSDFFDGDLDDVLIYRDQLDQNEIDALLAKSKPRFSSVARAYITNDPVAWWRFDDVQEHATVPDAVGDQHGMLNIVGESYFDGDDFVDVGAFDFDCERFSIAAIVKPSSFAVTDARIIAKENSLDSDDHFWSLSTTIRDDKPRLRFRLTTSDGTREVVSKSAYLETGHAALVLGTYDGTMMRLFQNGELVGQLKHSGRPKTNAHCHVWIGDTPAGAGRRPFDGEIAEVALFSTALSSTTARAIYHSTLNQQLLPQVIDDPKNALNQQDTTEESAPKQEPKTEPVKPKRKRPKRKKSEPKLEPEAEKHDAQPEKPETEKPETEKPETEKPETEKPETEKPETEKPETEKPETEKPETEKPETEKPETEKPETEKPETEKPETEKPETEKPETEKPETEKPETEKPQTEKPARTVEPEPIASPSAASTPYVPRCPLCDEAGHHKPVRRVSLHGPVALPFCYSPTRE